MKRSPAKDAASRSAPRVEAVGGLVQDEQVRALEQCGGDGQALLHAQRVGLEPIAVAAREADGLDGLVDTRGGDADDPGQQHQVAPSGQVGRELRGLHHGTDAVDHLRQPARHGLAEQAHLPAGRARQIEQHPDRRGLARPVGAEEAVSRSSTATRRPPRRPRNSLRSPVVSMTGPAASPPERSLTGALDHGLMSSMRGTRPGSGRAS